MSPQSPDNRLHVASIHIERGSVRDLTGYTAISSAFESRLIFDVLSDGARHELIERTLQEPLRKDYDALENPLRWSELFDVTNWVLVSAFIASRRVGGAIGAFNTPRVDMLEGRSDLVVLWDIRVTPAARGQGVGSALFRAVEEWGASRSCAELKVETQNVNVQACQLYRSQGCILAQAKCGAYPEFPDEIQLIWRKRING